MVSQIVVVELSNNVVLDVVCFDYSATSLALLTFKRRAQNIGCPVDELETATYFTYYVNAETKRSVHIYKQG
jgi:hypothetical protein